MVFLFELYLSLLRIVLLLLGTAVAVVLGGEALVHINDFLVNQAGLPCLEIFSFLALLVIPLAIVYGAHHQKYFWQRRMHYNLVILLVCIAVGIIMTVTPVDGLLMMSGTNTNLQVSTMSCYPVHVSWMTHMLGTVLVTILFGFIGLDIGATLKHASLRMQSRKPTKEKSSRRRK